jgi:hypothetical protein
MLETDASWVELYGISGELHIAGSPASDEVLQEPIDAVKKVRYDSLSSATNSLKKRIDSRCFKLISTPTHWPDLGVRLRFLWMYLLWM